MVMQKYKIPKFIENYKIQARESEINKEEKLSKVIKVVIKNQTLTVLFSFVAYFGFNNWLNIEAIRELPDFLTTMRNVAVSIFCFEVFFSCAHLSLHKWCYSIHKQHHEFVTPAAITAMYSSSIEHIFSNVLPAVIGFKFMSAHLSAVYLALAIILITTLGDHAGYHLPWLHSSQLHDYHHLKNNANYSVYGFMDLVFGTYGNFKNTKNYENHRTLWSFKRTKE